MILVRLSLAELQEGNYNDQYASQSGHDRLQPWLVLLLCRVLQLSVVESGLSATKYQENADVETSPFQRKTLDHLCTCALHRDWNNFVKPMSFFWNISVLGLYLLKIKDRGPDCLALRYPLSIVKGFVVILTALPVICTAHWKDAI